jgi:hypothetical protein
MPPLYFPSLTAYRKYSESNMAKFLAKIRRDPQSKGGSKKIDYIYFLVFQPIIAYILERPSWDVTFETEEEKLESIEVRAKRQIKNSLHFSGDIAVIDVLREIYKIVCKLFVLISVFFIF